MKSNKIAHIDLLQESDLVSTVKTFLKTLGFFTNYKKKSPEANIWCEVRDYKDLSEEPSIVLFQQWIDDFNKLTCLHNFNSEETQECPTHDPRVLTKMIKVGEKLAKEKTNFFTNYSGRSGKSSPTGH